MRHVARLAVYFALFLPGVSSPAFAQSSAAETARSTGIAIEQVGTLVYPPLLSYEAVFSGEVHAVISVDERGKLADSLITAYTKEPFAIAASEALARWRYSAATINGQPVASRANVLFVFRAQGVTVQTFPGAIVRQAFFSGLDELFQYRTYQLKDLDRIPAPVKVVSPAGKKGGFEHTVTVEFYIDEHGATRMPAVTQEAVDDIYAAAAVRAVEQWRFEPPMRKGRPVLVLVEQDFKFRTND